MTPKKAPRADLEKKKVLFLEIGLVVSISLAILVFGTGSDRVEPMPVAADDDVYVSEMTPVTVQEKKVAAARIPVRTVNLGKLNIVTNDRVMIDVPPIDFEDYETGDAAGTGAPGSSFGYVGGIDLGDEPLFVVEDMPKFQGGDLAKFHRWVSERLEYPRMAREMHITGRVVLGFVIERDGRLSQIEILDSPDRTLSQAAVKVLEQSPVWTPGYQNDVPARVRFTIPVDFVLQ